MKKTISDIIQECLSIHGTKYSYDKFTNYKNSKSKFIVTCKLHGDFEIDYEHHVRRKQNCPECSKLQRYKTKIYNNRIEPKPNSLYNYDKFEYTGIDNKSTVTCKLHGDFEVTPYNHFKKQSGCPKCKIDKLKKRNTYSLSKIIERFRNIHGELYNYSQVVYTGIFKPVDIICKDHGIFKQIAHSHLQGAGCPKCQLSKGETIIEQYLKDNNINYTSQKRFKDCRNKFPLPFDFYLPNYNICIEYHGKQHYEAIKYFGGETNFKIRQERDNIKLQYCLNNNIKLIIISYKQFNIIKTILDNYFN